VGLGHNLGGEVEPLAEVGETLVGEGVVVPLPRELGLDESLGSEGLHALDDLEVSDAGEVRVGREVEVLGGDKDTLLEESLVDLGLVVVGGLGSLSGMPSPFPCCPAVSRSAVARVHHTTLVSS